VTVIGNGLVFDPHLAENSATFVDARSLLAMSRELWNRRNVDVVHAHMTAAELAAAITPSGRASIISTRHFAAGRGSSRTARLAGRLVRRRLARQIAISRFVADEIGEPSIVILNGVAVAEAAIPDGRSILVTQRLQQEKRTVEALQAWHRSGLAADGWRLLIAGDGVQRPELEAYVTDHGVRGVEFLGHRRDISALRERAGLALATAPAEPFGLAVAEAMMAGLPVVASAAGGHLETVGAVRPDLLYPSGDVGACAALLRRLAASSELRRSIGADLRAHARRSLTIASHVDALESLYRSTVEDRRSDRDEPPNDGQRPLRVLRLFHGGVVESWRARERELSSQGCDLTLVSARRWNQGGNVVTLRAQVGEDVVGARTIGRHPYVFLFDPRPIVRELRRRQLDVIDVHEEPASLAALEIRMLRRVFQRRAAIVFYGAQNITKRYPPPFRWIERGSLRVAAGAYCCNVEAARIFRQKGLRSPAHVIGLGVDLERFSTPRRNTPRENLAPFRLGYVGRIEERKGVAVLLEAVRHLQDVRLDLYGDGPDRARLEAAAGGDEYGGRVTFQGFVDEGNLPTVYPRFDALAVPSLRTEQWVEQFGRVAIEAMAAGVPVIASDDGGLAEVVDGAGVLVTPGDVGAWTDAIRAAASNPSERERLSAAGLERAKCYSWAAVASAQRQLYDEAIRQ
jgi:glycosyltransferase involved in cell wall biosynthesis